MGLFILGCLLACLYCSLPWDDFTTDHLCWLLELIVSKTSSLVVCLRLFFLGSLSKNLLLGQFICGYSYWAVRLRIFFLCCTLTAVLLRILGCTSVTVLQRLLGCTSASVLLGLFACSCSSEAIPLSRQFLLLDSSPCQTESSSHCTDTCSCWDICLRIAVCRLRMAVHRLRMAVHCLQMAVHCLRMFVCGCSSMAILLWLFLNKYSSATLLATVHASIR